MTSTGTDADYSHAEGYKTTTGGQASHAEGDNTITNNPAEHAEGKYNKSNMGGTDATNTLHSVGIGNASGTIPGGERKNAEEIMYNGDMYVLGVGGYDGKTLTSASTVQTVINNKINTSDIVDDLDSTASDKVLSANMGRELAAYVDDSISDTMNFVIQERDAEKAAREAGDNLRYTKTESDARYVQQETGKGLSSNDYTDAEKTKLAGLENYDDTAVKAMISTEETARETEDEKLQNQIDAITSQSDVVDVVGTKAELDAYSKPVYKGDIVKVLVDESKENAISYYRVAGDIEPPQQPEPPYTWVYVGSQGPFYTKAEADTALNAKVDKTTTVNGHALSGNVTVSKSDVGLGNVPNVATNDQTPTYASSTLATLTSGEKLSVAFGKIAKAITDLISHIGDTVVHITSAERTAWNAKAGTAVATTSANGLMSSADKTKLDGVATGANKTVVDTAMSSSSKNPVQNKVINTALASKAGTSVATTSANGLMSSTDKAKLDGIDLSTKQDTLVGSGTGQNIKTVNSNNLLGSGNIAVGTITGVTVDGTSKATSGVASFYTSIGYYTCTTAAATVAKVGTYVSGAKYSTSYIPTGAIAVVKFTYANTAANPTLNLNSSGAKKMMQYGTTAIGNAAATTSWQAGAVCLFTFDGTNWVRNQGYNTDTNTTYSVATTSANGLMSSTDKTKLDGIETGANKITVDSALSSTSTNPVQNKVIYNLPTILSGTSEPASTTGKVGDIYIMY